MWRTEFGTEERDNILRPPLAALPSRFATARSYHIGVHPNAPPLGLLRQLRSAVNHHPEGVPLARHRECADTSSMTVY